MNKNDNNCCETRSKDNLKDPSNRLQAKSMSVSCFSSFMWTLLRFVIHLLFPKVRHISTAELSELMEIATFIDLDGFVLSSSVKRSKASSSQIPIQGSCPQRLNYSGSSTAPIETDAAATASMDSEDYDGRGYIGPFLLLLDSRSLVEFETSHLKHAVLFDHRCDYLERMLQGVVSLSTNTQRTFDEPDVHEPDLGLLSSSSSLVPLPPVEIIVVTYCSLGVRSAVAAAHLVQNQELRSSSGDSGPKSRLSSTAGHPIKISVFNLEGSIFAWWNEHRPVYCRAYQRETETETQTDCVHPYSSFWGLLFLKNRDGRQKFS